MEAETLPPFARMHTKKNEHEHVFMRVLIRIYIYMNKQRVEETANKPLMCVYS